MHRFARVVAESDLLQLDREFDFLVPEHLQNEIRFGQRVKFEIGRSKKQYTGFVVDLPVQSEFATSELLAIADPTPVLTPEVYGFARQVADRQCVAVGETLSLAIPDHMPRIALSEPEPSLIQTEVGFPKLDVGLTKRSAVLTSSRSIEALDEHWPDWALLFVAAAQKEFLKGKSSILVVPEQDQVQILERLLVSSGVQPIVLGGSQKKAERYRSFRALLSQEQSVVIGTRNAVYAPAKNLGLVALFDDLDDSLREPGSPNTNARELVLMRGDQQVILAANYRSVEVQRLVQIGYLSDHSVVAPPPRISFSAPGARVDQSAFNAIRERLEVGPVLVLIPRKGSSSAGFCGGCGERLSCQKCGGSIWEPESGRFSCRVCQRTHVRCLSCGSDSVRPGRTGSSRTVSQLGNAFPNVTITEATADKRPSRVLPKRQLVIATPSSAPRVKGGYAAVLILDPDVWLASQSLRAEQLAIRDWQEAFELLSQEGRALIVGINPDLGQAISLQQHRELAAKALVDLGTLQLPPMVRIARLEGSPETITAALSAALEAGATEISSEVGQGTALIRFSYQLGPKVATALRTLALKTNARLVGVNKRRGLKIVMDDPTVL